MFDIIQSFRETYGTVHTVAAAAFVIGVSFGIVAEISRYCTRAAIAEWAAPDRNSASYAPRTISVLTAVIVAVAGTQALAYFGLLDLQASIYRSAGLRPLALIAGGALFGVGMVLAGGCVSRLLVLAASGNGRSWVTLLVTGLAAYATLRGILSYPRTELENAWLAAPADGTPAWVHIAVIALVIVVAALGIIASSRKASPAAFARPAAAGLAIGALVVAGWVATGIVGADDFDPTPVASLSIEAPVGETLQYAMIFTGDSIRFSIALVLGVLVGAFTSAVFSGRFHGQGFTDEGSLLRYAAGGVLMGFGGVTALGCTVGQGLSGLSTGAPSSLIAILSIVAGAAATIRLRAVSGRQLFRAIEPSHRSADA